jgi:hypothetical protein
MIQYAKNLWLLGLAASLLIGKASAQQVTPDDLAQILERADKLLDEAKATFERARASGSVDTYIEAGFTLEEARIKYLVLQELGQGDRQKTAIDRLRSVNQLSKMIHDGKVAAAGSPVAPFLDKPPDPPPAPADKPALPAGADVTRRLPVPDAGKQKEAEKVIRELFKEQYAKKGPEDRQRLSHDLLEQAAKSQDDPAAVWALLREAQEVALQGGDLKGALAAADATARTFDVDGMALRHSALAAFGKLAKSPDEFAALAEAQDAVIDDFVQLDQYDAAEKAATLLGAYARKSNDGALISRAARRSKEVAEARSLFQGMKGILETLAKSPADLGSNLEMGKFLCFVKGNWDLGLRFLVKGGDVALKALAERELAVPEPPVERLALADGWYELGDKEKSPLRKSQLLSHARSLYERALPGASGLAKTKIEMRLEALAGPAPSPASDRGSLDLLSLIDCKKDSVKTEWTLEGRLLLSPGNPSGEEQLALPYEAPEEYDLLVVAERRFGAEALHLLITSGPAQCAVVLDSGGVWGIDVVDAKQFRGNVTTAAGTMFTNDKSSTVLCSVRKSGITVTFDGKAIIRWQGNRASLAAVDFFHFPRSPKQLYLGCCKSRWVISKLQLTPVTGQGKKLR